MSKAASRQPVSERLSQTVPDGKRLVVRDANGKKVIAYEAGATPDQQLLPGHTVELVDLASTQPPEIPEPFERFSPKLAIAALIELLGVKKEDLLAKADEIRLRDEADSGSKHDSGESEDDL